MREAGVGRWKMMLSIIENKLADQCSVVTTFITEIHRKTTRAPELSLVLGPKLGSENGGK